MAKTKTQFVCQSCGYISPRWIGKCAECNSWNSFVEEAITVVAEHPRAQGARHFSNGAKNGSATNGHAAQPVRLSEISGSEEGRIATGIMEFDRVLGGGIMPGSIVLIGGDPGIGKSTLMMQMVRALPFEGSALGARTLYVSGEESAKQLKSRAERLGLINDNLYILSETNVETVLDAMRQMMPDLVIVDSIQTMYRATIESAPGSVTQVRECTALLMQVAKMTGIPVFVIGHVTKEGMIAGPKVLEHIVDTVLQFEGERTHAYRILRAAKNRYGRTNEIGVFSMTSSGLEEVSNPSEIFLSERQYGSSGSAVCAILEGSRPMLLEIQALVTNSNFNNPQRTVNGYDLRRVAMLLAVLEKRLDAKLSRSDVFINVAGGLFIDEPAADLAIAMAVLSNHRDIPLDSSACLIGEVGLGGEVRAVPQADVRVLEAVRLGFEHIILPKANMKSIPKMAEKITLRPVENCRSSLPGIMTLVLATHNRHKREELLAILRAELAGEIELKTLDDIEPPIGDIPETGVTLEENAFIKARTVYERTNLPTLADDTGLEVSALNGAPGVFSARYAGENVTYEDNVRKLLGELKGKEDRAAKFSTVIAYIDESGTEHHFRGEVAGNIVKSPQGERGFGYDPIFAPLEDAQGRTFAEMMEEEKNAISHRGRALRKLAAHLLNDLLKS